jgi:hypothetical protein
MPSAPTNGGEAGYYVLDYFEKYGIILAGLSGNGCFGGKIRKKEGIRR